ncbi:MAG: class I SAM-dependent methyltransferase, partial [Candidatus Eremiobacteraeota bacterium]|nr:class I SAM-dependent methyltransferase [Candidatus Eremiobacteraeota bacterium]
GRTGYSNELYDTIEAAGLVRGAAVVDVACGTGLASEPFALNGFPVIGIDASPEMLEFARRRVPEATFIEASAEELPFPDERFDLALSADAFQWLDKSRALAEMQRVLKRGGLVAIWWKFPMSDDALKRLRDDVLTEFVSEAPQPSLAGFREFYAAPLADQTLRVLPWRTSLSLSRYVKQEQSSCTLRSLLGDRLNSYANRLREVLEEHYGAGDPLLSVSYLQYLYLAKKP